MSGSRWMGDKALSLLRDLPRLSVNNVNKIGRVKIVKRNTRKHGAPTPTKLEELQRFPAIGYEHFTIPKAYKVPYEKSYNYGWQAKRQYPPLSLKNLQLLIDTGRLNVNHPIDLASLCNTKVLHVYPQYQHFGLNLTDEGADCFKATVNLEVQYASEAAIAAVERNGGVLTTAYFDINCVTAMVDSKKWLEEGKPIPRRLHPPADAIGYYTNAANRGYLADPRAVAEERLVLAQKYGYELPNLKDNPVMCESKDPRQVFYGLEPGWLVNLADKLIYKPSDKELKEYYQS